MGPYSGGMITRRGFLGAAAASAVGCARATPAAGPPGKAAVAILRASSYDVDLVERLARGAALCGLNARGKRVLGMVDSVTV